MKVVFLGSFDPPTNGHLHLISEALWNGASEVVMVPAYSNPWKTSQTDYQRRLEMCQLLPGIIGKLVISGIEGDLAKSRNLPYIPTYLTLRALRKSLGEFEILTTNETYPEIERWTNGEEILRDYKFMIFSSERFGSPINNSFFIHDIPISSSLVRDKMEIDGRECPEYVPIPVYRYIKEHRLYE